MMLVVYIFMDHVVVGWDGPWDLLMTPPRHARAILSNGAA